MTALTTGKDPTLNGTNTDNQPGILTFQTICNALGQTDVYTTVKARIDKVAADAKAKADAEKVKADAEKVKADAEKVKATAQETLKELETLITYYTPITTPNTRVNTYLDDNNGRIMRVDNVIVKKNIKDKD